MTIREIQNIMADVLSKQVFLPNVSPENLIITESIPQTQFKILVRLNKYYVVLPTPEQIINEFNQTGKKAEGAPWLLIGLIQIVGEKIRVTTRIVRTETTEISRASKGDGDNSTIGLSHAFQTALTGLNINYVS